jgi:hypothetical protein
MCASLQSVESQISAPCCTACLHLQKRKTAGSDSDEAAADSEDDFEQPAAKRRGGKKAAASGGSRPAAAASGGSKYGPKVEKLRRMCRAAGITVGPNVYVKVGASVASLLAVVAVHVECTAACGGSHCNSSGTARDMLMQRPVGCR